MARASDNRVLGPCVRRIHVRVEWGNNKLHSQVGEVYGLKLIFSSFPIFHGLTSHTLPERVTFLLELSGYIGNWISSVSVNHCGGIAGSRRSCKLGLVTWFTCHILAFRVEKRSHQYDHTYNLCECVYLVVNSASWSQIAPKKNKVFLFTYLLIIVISDRGDFWA